MFFNKRFGLVGAMLTATLAHAQTSPPAGGLTLDQVDTASRAQLLKELSGVAPAPASLPSAPVVAPPPPVERPARKAAESATRSVPVTFVGSFTDVDGTHVLYEFDGAVYSAGLGARLLNGWIARKVTGFVVTVADGRREISIPIRSAAPAPLINAGPIQALGDLGGPLPPGGIFGGNAATQIGR